MDAQINLSVVASDSFGVSGRAMLAGERDAKRLAQLARARLRAKLGPLAEAFTGLVTDQHAFLLGKMLARVDALDADLAELDAKLQEPITPFTAAVDRLDAVPGSARPPRVCSSLSSAWTRARFPTAGHLVSWAKYAPGVSEPPATPRQRIDRARQPLPGSRARRGRRRRQQDRYLPGERYRPIARRRGKQQAIVVVGRSILVIVWQLLSDPTVGFHDLGAGLLRHPHRSRTRQTQPHPPARSPRRQGHPGTRRLTGRHQTTHAP